MATKKTAVKKIATAPKKRRVDTLDEQEAAGSADIGKAEGTGEAVDLARFFNEAPISITNHGLSGQIKNYTSHKGTRLIFDTETTGLVKPDVAKLDEQPYIIEIGLIQFDADYNITRTYNQLIKPPVPITEEITKITGITNEQLEGMPTLAQVMPALETMFLGCREVIAHNMPFDKAMLVNELRRIGRETSFPYPPIQTCTVQVASDLMYGRRARMKELYEDVTGQPLAQSHRALDDCGALFQIIKAKGW